MADIGSFSLLNVKQNTLTMFVMAADPVYLLWMKNCKVIVIYCFSIRRGLQLFEQKYSAEMK